LTASRISQDSSSKWGPDAVLPWVEAFDERLQIFCGNGGLYLIDCLRFGAAGVAPGVDSVDLLVEIHELWQSDRADEAWEPCDLWFR
jgi:hypothetical protein